MRSPLFRLVADLPETAAHRLAALLEAAGAESYTYYDIGGGRWRAELLVEGAPDAFLRTEFEDHVRRAGGGTGTTRVEPVPELDWLAENRKDFAPVRVGRYFIHGTLAPVAVPVGAVGIVLDAGMAFGTGRHATTWLCLSAMDRLARRRRFRRVLDLGAGAGILAIAAARTWPATVMATDIDPVAVAVARGNLRRNGVAPQVEVFCRDGLGGLSGRFDLVLANILAAPLLRMARAIAASVASGGVLVLSGMLEGQAASVLVRYRGLGLVLRARLDRDGWTALVMERGRGTVPR